LAALQTQLDAAQASCCAMVTTVISHRHWLQYEAAVEAVHSLHAHQAWQLKAEAMDVFVTHFIQYAVVAVCVSPSSPLV
jgi:hypothetical protein